MQLFWNSLTKKFTNKSVCMQLFTLRKKTSSIPQKWHKMQYMENGSLRSQFGGSGDQMDSEIGRFAADFNKQINN